MGLSKEQLIAMVNTEFNKEEDTFTKNFYIDMINEAKEKEVIISCHYFFL